MSTLSRRRFLAGMSLAALASCGKVADIAPKGRTDTPSTRVAATPAEAPATPVPEAHSDKPRQRGPQASPDDVRALAAGHTAFGLALYQLLHGEAGNLFFSPYSIAQAFTMLSAGARGNTAKQIADVLRSAFPQDHLHSAANALDLALTSRGAAQDGFQLEIANSVWGQRDHTFRPEFLDLLAENYGAGLRTIDFRSAPDSARQKINAAIAQQTHDKIKELLPPDSIDAQTAMVLANAIYFNAKWRYPFKSNHTSDWPFHLDGGGTVITPLMSQMASLDFVKRADYEGVILPYQGGVSMLVIMPREGGMSAFEQSLSVERLQAIRREMGGEYIALSLPKFTHQSASVSLRQALTQLGMGDAFSSGNADFSGIDGGHDLYVNDAFHQAMVRVDEEGTEAAAATAAVVEPAAGPSAQIVIDRPFIFAIQDDATGALLFMGRIMNPKESA